MAWVRMDDKFPRGRKVKRAARLLGGGKRARARILAVWCDAMAYCNLNLTDGFFPDDEVDELPDASPSEVFGAMAHGDAELGAMVERDEHRNGWQFRNYAEYQPTKALVESKLERDRIRKMSTRNPRGRIMDSTHTEPARPEPDRTGPSRPRQEVQTNTEDQRDRPAQRMTDFDDVRQHCKAAAYAYLAEHPDCSDGELADAVKDAAGKLRVWDYTGRKVTAVVNEVRGYLATVTA
jgi:hypothetical protein